MTISSTSLLKKILIIFFVIAGIYFAKEFLMPIAIAAILATLFFPFCNWLEVKKVPKPIATFICFLILLLAMIGIGALVTWQINEMTDDLAIIKQKMAEGYERVQQYILNDFGISVNRQSEILKDQQDSITGIISVMAGSLVGVLSSLVLVLVYVFLLLHYRVHIKNFIVKISPSAQREAMERVAYLATKISRQYFLGFAKMMVLLWGMYFIGFSIMGVKNAVFFAMLCSILEIVPFIGNLVGTSVTVLASAVQGAPLSMLGGIVVTYGIVQFIQGWVLEPLIVGPQVKINPLFTIVALVLGEILWGIPGIILAIPTTAILKVVCDNIEPLQPFGFFIGEIETSPNKDGVIKKIGKFFAFKK